MPTTETLRALEADLCAALDAIRTPMHHEGWAAARDWVARRWLIEHLGLDEGDVDDDDERFLAWVIGWDPWTIAGVARLALLARSRVPELP